MRNIEYHASIIVWDLIMKPNVTQRIYYKPLADMVVKMLKEITSKYL